MGVIKSLIFFLVGNETSWFFLRPFSRIGSFISRVRNEIEVKRKVQTEEDIHEELFGTIFHERKVLHGPFKGLQYPSYNAIGSVLYPKLIGSYEKELHWIMESLSAIEFSEIINIGSGEGYYAVGLCLKFSKAKIFACDTDPQAMVLCQKMAELNHVTDRIIFKNEIRAADLKEFKFTTRGLIICDCEGFEKSLFDLNNLDNLKACYLLIETHDFLDITITSFLIELFSSTHMITIIKSLDDIEKAKLYQFEETRFFDLVTKKKLFGERRPAIMEWLYLSPKSKGL